MWGLASSPSLCCALHCCGGNYKCGGMPQLTDFRSYLKFFLGALFVSELEIWLKSGLVYKAKKKGRQ